MTKIFYSVELAPNYEDDTFCGSYEECISHLISNEYKHEEARIVKYRLEKGGEDQVLCEYDLVLQPNDDPETIEIIEDWSADWGENFKELRGRYAPSPARYTQKNISEITGIPERTIGNWETGERVPPPYMLELIACKLRSRLYTGD